MARQGAAHLLHGRVRLQSRRKLPRGGCDASLWRAIRGRQCRAWAAHLRGWRRSAARQAARGLHLLAKRAAGRGAVISRLAEAGLWHVLGAAQGNSTWALRRSLAACRRGDDPAVAGRQQALRRMEAETLLRLREYKAAFCVFTELAKLPVPWEDLLVSPFHLHHDAVLVTRLVRLGRLDAVLGGAMASSLRRVAEGLAGEEARGRDGGAASTLWWVRMGDLAQCASDLLRSANFAQLGDLCPYPVPRLAAWEDACPLASDVDWARVDGEFSDQGLIVLDGFFNDAALEELWSYVLEAPCFKSLRPGYLGAFPADGCTHPLLRCAAEALERRLLQALAGKPLARWWLFKYTAASPAGVGLHADDAAVNVNIWLTPDSARRQGGGLDVHRRSPKPGTTARDFNCVPEQGGATSTGRDEVDHVPFRRNRAVIFVSDRFHRSEPFDFPDPDEAPRANLTLLFGDRVDAQSDPQRVPCTMSKS